jgi:hypothetical protein
MGYPSSYGSIERAPLAHQARRGTLARTLPMAYMIVFLAALVSGALVSG